MELEIKGIKELFDKLGDLQSVDILEQPMQRSMFRLEARAKEYPAPPARSTYVRTGTLGRRWLTQVNKIHGGIQGKIGNNTEYGPWVQSRRFQADVHKGRWKTAEDVLEELTKTITNDFNETIEEAIK